MIDFPQTSPDERTYYGRLDAERFFSRPYRSPELYAHKSKIPDQARRLIASKPALFIAAAFIAGGALGWLTSTR